MKYSEADQAAAEAFWESMGIFADLRIVREALCKQCKQESRHFVPFWMPCEACLSKIHSMRPDERTN